MLQIITFITVDCNREEVWKSFQRKLLKFNILIKYAKSS